MRLQIFSDLHLECGSFAPTLNRPDVVVLAGDIHQGTAGVKWAKQSFPDCPVVYVAGNHEFYNHSITDLLPALQHEAKGSNVQVLENSIFEFNGLVFLGCSLWSDFKICAQPRVAMVYADRFMSDFSQIHQSPGRQAFCARDAAKIHAASVHWLTRQLADHDPARTVVVTHHAPSPRSLDYYHPSDLLSGAFASDLDALIRASRVPLWIHGHTHHNVDYRIGKTRVYSNQRGYPDEQERGFKPEKTIKIL
jgi:Icc-related predicted phosphoesterase